MKLVKILIAALLIAGAANVSSQPNQTAWVVNTLGNTMSRVDLSTGLVTVNAVALGQYANDVVISGTTGYVVNSGDNQIQMIDLQTSQTTGTIEIYLGLNPWAIALDDNHRAYVTNALTGNVSILDLSTNQEVDTLVVGTSLEGVCVYQNVLYVTDTNLSFPNYGQGYVHAYSLPDLNHLAVIPVATNPQVIMPGPDTLIHVVCTGDFGSIPGQVQLISPTTFTVVDSIAIGSIPGSLAFNPQGIGYLGVSTLAGTGGLLSYNGITHQIIHGASNPIRFPVGVWDVAVTDSGHILACCFGSDQLLELNRNDSLVQTYSVGDGPVSVAMWESPNATLPSQLIVQTYRLLDNYPNPFNASTIIVFSLPIPQRVLLSVFDISGRSVWNLDMGWQPSGLVKIPFQPAAGLVSGRYFYKVQAGSLTASSEMIYQK